MHLSLQQPCAAKNFYHFSPHGLFFPVGSVYVIKLIFPCVKYDFTGNMRVGYHKSKLFLPLDVNMISSYKIVFVLN